MNRYFGLHILEGEWHSLLPRYLLLADRIEGKRILDIGCGSGIGASLLLELGASMVDAIDHRPAVLELARMKHAKDGLDFHVMFWEEVDFPDDTFDMVLCLDPTSPVTDPNLLKEVNRVLKSGGEYVCAIERKNIDGLEVLLPRYGYTDAAESIDIHSHNEKPPQVGELQKFFDTATHVVQRPVLAFAFESGDDEKAVVDDRLRQRDDDDASVEMWFCGGEGIATPSSLEVRLPYFSLVERLTQVINELQMRQVRSHESEGFFDEILDDGPSEVFERERENTNEYRVVDLEETPTRTKIKALRNDLAADADHPTFVRHEPVGAAPRDGLESQLAELSALYHQVRQEFQTVVRDAQTALEERDRYIEHLVGTVQQWQHRFDSDAEDLSEGTSAFVKDDTPTGEVGSDDSDASEASEASEASDASEASEPSEASEASDASEASEPSEQSEPAEADEPADDAADSDHESDDASEEE